MSQLHALVVDDDPSLRSLLATWLRQLGLEPTTVDTAKEAIEVLDKFEFDLVLLDYYLPDATGEEVLRAIRAIHRDVPVIVMSGDATVDMALRVVDRGALHVTGKPLDLADLEVRVRTMIPLDRRGADESRPGGGAPEL